MGCNTFIFTGQAGRATSARLCSLPSFLGFGRNWGLGLKPSSSCFAERLPTALSFRIAKHHQLHTANPSAKFHDVTPINSITYISTAADVDAAMPKHDSTLSSTWLKTTKPMVLRPRSVQRIAFTGFIKQPKIADSLRQPMRSSTSWTQSKMRGLQADEHWNSTALTVSDCSTQS
jgi:hypothetical protein